MAGPNSSSPDSGAASSDPSSLNGKPFTNKRVNIILDEYNYLLWKQQVLLAVRSHRLEKLLLGTAQSPPATKQGTDGTPVENEEFEAFTAQDSALASWLLSTISHTILPDLVGAETAADIWNTITSFFARKFATTLMNLHYQLKSVTKGDLTIRAYINQVKEISDALAVGGSPISEFEQIATILNGLPIEYRPFITVITASREQFTLEGITSILVDAETQQRNFERLDNLHISANPAHVHTRSDGSQNRGGMTFELAFSTAYAFAGIVPCFLEVDHVDFLRPVDVGDFLRLKSCVLFTHLENPDQPLINVEVVAHVTRPEIRTSEVSNTFYFTISVRPEAKTTKNGFKIRNVVPATEEEARRILERRDAEM